MKKVKVYYACMSGGDGSVSLEWYLTKERASTAEESQSEGFAEDCTGEFAAYPTHKKCSEPFKDSLN